jgi:hypothetical protein
MKYNEIEFWVHKYPRMAYLLVGWLVGLFLLVPLGAQGIRETLRFTSVS